MNEYVLGIDTGATKSHLALFDTSGTFTDFCHWGPLNHELLPGSFTQFEDELGDFILQTLSKNRISIDQVSYAVFGIAGADTILQHKIISRIITNIGLKKFTLANDAFLGIPAGSPSGTGICANNGTGCTLAGLNREGKMLQIGGVGFISDDFGGGGFLGERITSAVYRELFRKGEKTCLTDALFEKLEISSKYDFIEKFYEKTDDKSFTLNSCSKMLFEAASKDDPVAKDIIFTMAKSYADGISCMIEELCFNNTEELAIVFAGSVFVKGEDPLLLNSLKEMINQNNPQYRFLYNLLDVPPVAGAVIWALNSIGERGTFYDKVCAQLKNKTA